MSDLSKLIKLSPSASCRWRKCPASALLQRLAKYSPSPCASLGTGVMAKIEELLNRIDGNVHDLQQFVGKKEVIEGNDITYTQEDMDAASVCFNIIRCHEDVGYDVKVEDKVTYRTEFDGQKYAINGRIDFWYDRKEKYHVIDYKHGVGNVVSAVGNGQLMIYTMALIQKYGPRKSYAMEIIQPRARYVTEKYCKMEHDHFLVSFDALRRSMERAHNLAKDFDKTHRIPMDCYAPGDNCKWCAVEHCCPARVNAQLALSVAGGGDVSGILTGDYYGDILASADAAGPVVSNAKKSAEEILLKGEKVKGYKLVASRGKRSLNEAALEKDIEKVIALGLAKKAHTYAPLSEFDKAYKKDKSTAKYINRGAPSYKLVPESEEGKPYDPARLLDTEEVTEVEDF